MARLFVGVDPGAQGVIAVLAPTGSGLFAAVYKLGDHPGRTIARLIGSHRELKADIFVAVEQTYAHKGGPMGQSASHSLGKSEGAVIGALDALNVPYVSIRPQEWKKLVLAGTPKDKGAAVAHALSAYPQCPILRPGGKPDDNMAEALCLAEYAMRTRT